MRITLSIPDPVAKRFQSAIPPRHRSRLVTRLIEDELQKGEDILAKACHAANQDIALEAEIDEWQSFEDTIES
jgi:metal-responsive CopG/Arc/MetJ family transcriptional regulator